MHRNTLLVVLVSRIDATACLRPLLFCLTKNWTRICLAGEEEHRVGCDGGVSSLLRFLVHVAKQEQRAFFLSVTKSSKLHGKYTNKFICSIRFSPDAYEGESPYIASPPQTKAAGLRDSTTGQRLLTSSCELQLPKAILLKTILASYGIRRC